MTDRPDLPGRGDRPDRPGRGDGGHGGDRGTAWPVAGLDPVRRLRIVESQLPGVGATERLIDAPFDRVWSFVADIERSVPAFDPLVARVEVRGREPADGGERLSILTWGRGLPVPVPLDMRLEDGLCLMQGTGRWIRAGWFLVGMAARPVGDRTLFRHVEGTGLPGTRRLRWLFERTSRQDVDGIERAVHQHP